MALNSVLPFMSIFKVVPAHTLTVPQKLRPEVQLLLSYVSRLAHKREVNSRGKGKQV